MWIASLGSGSQGNATLVRSGGDCLLVDCGFSRKQFEHRLQRLDLNASDISAILVTHEHGDHGQGVAAIARHYAIPLWMTVGTARALGIEHYQSLAGGQLIEMAGLSVEAVTVPHDAAEPVQYVFTEQASGRRLGILTDCGHVTPHMINAYANLHGLLLEFNYDPKMLEQGPYPPALKRRVSGLHGHLSNRQSLELLQQLQLEQLGCLIVAHISQKNNHPDLVRAALCGLPENLPKVLACQQQGVDWIEI